MEFKILSGDFDRLRYQNKKNKQQFYSVLNIKQKLAIIKNYQMWYVIL